MATTARVPLQTYLDAAMRHAQLQWLPDDKMWLADLTIPELQGASSAQPTQEWALRELREVVKDLIAWIVEDGEPLPDIDGMALDRTTVAA